MVPDWHLDLDLDLGWERITELWGDEGLVGGVWIGVKELQSRDLG